MMASPGAVIVFLVTVACVLPVIPVKTSGWCGNCYFHRYRHYDVDGTNRMHQLPLMRQESVAAAGADSDSSADQNQQHPKLSPPSQEDFLNRFKRNLQRREISTTYKRPVSSYDSQ